MHTTTPTKKKEFLTNKNIKPREVVAHLLIPALSRQRQADACEIEASLQSECQGQMGLQGDLVTKIRKKNKINIKEGT